MNETKKPVIHAFESERGTWYAAQVREIREEIIFPGTHDCVTVFFHPDFATVAVIPSESPGYAVDSDFETVCAELLAGTVHEGAQEPLPEDYERAFETYQEK